MHKKLLTIGLAGSLVMTSFPRDSHALTGAGLALFGAAGAGSVALIGGTLSVGGLLLAWIDPGFTPDERITVFSIGAWALIAGIVTLDAPGVGAPQMQAMSTADAGKLGVTASDVLAYNSELDQINAVLESVTSDGRAFAATEQDAGKRVQFAQTSWDSYAGQAISPAARAVVEKIVGSISLQK